MNPSRFRALFSFFPSANSATNRRRVGKSFRHFIPPLLLSSRPHLFFAAVHASKQSIDVITSLHEIGSSIAVIWREQFRVDRDQIVWRRFNHPCAIAQSACRPSSALPENLLAPLFAVFHWNVQSGGSDHSALQAGQSTATLWVSPPRRYE